MDDASALDVVRDAWPNATLREDDAEAQRIADALFSDDRATLPLLVRGTNFQVRVWQALLGITAGTTTSYASLAHAVGNDSAARAVGNALASNRIAVLIPCHRVLATTGVVGNYRWGSGRKRALLAWERATAQVR